MTQRSACWTTPEADLADLMQYVKGRTFPQGDHVGRSGIRAASATQSGPGDHRARTEFEIRPQPRAHPDHCH